MSSMALELNRSCSKYVIPKNINKYHMATEWIYAFVFCDKLKRKEQKKKGVLVLKYNVKLPYLNIFLQT